MKLFSLGPVNMRKEILEIGMQQPPYFRTSEFSKINFDNEKMILSLIKSSGRVAVLTSSGTGAMDAVASNFAGDSRILVVNGGTFGELWVDICRFYDFDYIEMKVPFGKDLNLEQFDSLIEQQNIKFVFAQGTETSSGQKFPLRQMGEITKKHDAYFIVDAITSFLADPYEMDSWNIDVSVLSSQKGLGLPPGLSVVIVGLRALQSLNKKQSTSYYFDLSREFANMDRGQTAFSPAVVSIFQLNSQLKYLTKLGYESIIKQVQNLAMDFRYKISDLPFNVIAETPSNCLTALRIDNSLKSKYNAYDLFRFLIDKYDIFISPVGGEYAESDFRVCHLGELTKNDNTMLIQYIKQFIKQFNR